MSLILSIPHAGRTRHIYDEDGDNKSLCNRSPLNSYKSPFNIDMVTCEVCKRAYQTIVRNLPPGTPSSDQPTPHGDTSPRLKATKRPYHRRSSLSSKIPPTSKRLRSNKDSKKKTTSKGAPKASTRRLRGQKSSRKYSNK